MEKLKDFIKYNLISNNVEYPLGKVSEFAGITKQNMTYYVRNQFIQVIKKDGKQTKSVSAVELVRFVAMKKFGVHIDKVGARSLINEVQKALTNK